MRTPTAMITYSAPTPTHAFEVHTRYLSALPDDVEPGFEGVLRRNLDQLAELIGLISDTVVRHSAHRRMAACGKTLCGCWRIAHAQAIAKVDEVLAGVPDVGSWILEAPDGGMMCADYLAYGLGEALGKSRKAPAAPLRMRFDPSTRAGAVTRGQQRATFYALSRPARDLMWWVTDRPSLEVARTAPPQTLRVLCAAMHSGTTNTTGVLAVLEDLAPLLGSATLCQQAEALLAAGWNSTVPALVTSLLNAGRSPRPYAGTETTHHG